MTTTAAALTIALEARRPEVAASYKRIVQGRFAAMVEALGPKLPGVRSDWTWHKVFTNTVGPNIRRNHETGAFAICEDKLEANAAKYANAVVEGWKNKIIEKMGEMDNAEVKHIDGCAYRISGTKGGRAVFIEQDMILNTSPKGTLFNQFPARIYLDGKFISAAAFKKAFA